MYDSFGDILEKSEGREFESRQVHKSVDHSCDSGLVWLGRHSYKVETVGSNPTCRIPLGFKQL